MAKKRSNSKQQDNKQRSIASVHPSGRRAASSLPSSPSSLSSSLWWAVLFGAACGAPLGWLLKFGDRWGMGMVICGTIGFLIVQRLSPDVLDDEQNDLSFLKWLVIAFISRVVPTAICSFGGYYFDKIGRHSSMKLYLSIALGALLGGAIAAAVHPLLKTKSAKRIIRPFGLTMMMMFIFLWVLPFLWVGGAKKGVPGYPAFLQNLYRISCLFTSSANSWKTAHFQVQFKGSKKWVEGFEPGIFDQSIFGYRTRFNRVLGQSINRGRKGQQRQRMMAEYIRDRWMLLYPNDPPIESVRYVRVVHRINESHCMANERWTKLPLKTYPQPWRIEATHDLTKPFKYIPKKKKNKKKKKKKSTGKAERKSLIKAIENKKAKTMLLPSIRMKKAQP